jgi:hypothetical protein
LAQEKVCERFNSDFFQAMKLIYGYALNNFWICSKSEKIQILAAAALSKAWQKPWLEANPKAGFTAWQSPPFAGFASNAQRQEAR